MYCTCQNVTFSVLTIALLGYVLTLTAPYVEREERRYLCFLFALLSVYIACDLIEQVSQYFLGADFFWLTRVGVFFELLFSVAIVPSITAYLIRCIKEDWRASILFRSALAIYGACVVVLVAAQFSDAVYHFSFEEKRVLPGPYYPVLIIPPILLMTLNLVGLVRRKDMLTRRQNTALAICTVTPSSACFYRPRFSA